MILQPVPPPVIVMQTTPPRGGLPGFIGGPMPTLDLTHATVFRAERPPLHNPLTVSPMDVQAARALQELCNAAALQQCGVPAWPSARHYSVEPPSPVARSHTCHASTGNDKGSASDGSSSTRERFMAEVKRLAAENGTPLVRVPEMGSKALDLYELYQRVAARGGLNVVVANKLWKPVAKELGIPLGSCTDYGFRLRRHYIRYLLPYEQMHGATETKMSSSGKKKRKHQADSCESRQVRPRASQPTARIV